MKQELEDDYTPTYSGQRWNDEERKAKRSQKNEESSFLSSN